MPQEQSQEEHSSLIIKENTLINGKLWLAGRGSRKSDIMFVSPSVFPEEYNNERDMGNGLKKKVNPAYLRSEYGFKFKDSAIKFGIDLDKCFYCSLLRYLPESLKEVRAPKKTSIAECLWATENDIMDIQPRIICCLGKQVFDALMPFKQKESDIYGAYFYNEKYNCMVYPMLPITQLIAKPECISRFNLDFDIISSLQKELDGKAPSKVKLNYEVIHNSKELFDLIIRLANNNHNIISVDCEWHGHNHVDGQLRSLQLGWAPGEAAYIRFMDDALNYVFDISYKSAGKVLSIWLDRPEVKYIGHHISADLPWMHYKLGLQWYNKAIFDTEFAQQCVNEASNLGLEAIALKYTDLGRYDLELSTWKHNNEKEKTRDGYGLIPDDIMIPYACLRGDSLIRLGTGEWMPIKKIVDDKYKGSVYCLVDNKIRLCRITNWYKSESPKQEWRRLETNHSQFIKGEVIGPTFTPDHKILTKRGLVQVSALFPGYDEIPSGYLNFTDNQEKVLLGLLIAGCSIRGANKSPSKTACLIFREEVPLHIRKMFRPYLDKFQDIDWNPILANFVNKYGIKPDQHINSKVIRNLSIYSFMTIYSILGRKELGHDVIDLSHLSSESISKIIIRLHELRITTTQNGKILIIHKAHKRFMKTNLNKYTFRCEKGTPYYYKLEKTHRVTLDELKHRELAETRYCISVDTAQNFMTSIGIVSNCKDVDTVVRAYPRLKALMEKQDLMPYWNNIFGPLVTNGFTSFCLRGIPIDVETANRIRDFYAYIKKELSIKFHKRMEEESYELLLKAIQEANGENGTQDIYNKVLTYYLTQEYDEVIPFLKKSIGVNYEMVIPAWEHFLCAPSFNERTPQLRRYLFDVKKYTPVKSTKQKDRGIPSISWKKILTFPPERQKQFTPQQDKQTIEILSFTHNDDTLRLLLQYLAVGNICKQFLKPADVDEDGEVERENGIHYWIASDGHIHGQTSATETGRLRG